MELRVLGPIEVYNGHRLAVGGPRQRRILAALAMQTGEVVSIDRLVDIIWSGERPPANAERNVRSYVHRIRTGLGESADLLATAPPGYVLELEPAAVDAVEFARLAAQADRTFEQGDPAGALTTADDALALWRGHPYAEFADEEWVQAQAVRLEELRVRAMGRRCEALIELDRAEEALGALDALIEQHPYQERPRRLNMLALYRAGRQPDALRTFQDFRSILVEEVGVDPSEELVTLDRQILDQDPALRRDASAGRALRGYVLDEVIGEGAFALVWRGTQPVLGRDVAVKQIRAQLANDPGFIRRFEVEAQIVSSLEHPYIVPLYDYWREPDAAYLVMRMLKGGTLETRLEAGPLTDAELERMVTQIGPALRTAHRNRVIHRDVKPGNILLDEEGNFFLTDFGIAFGVEGEDDAAAAMSTGSPSYASPEQLRRDPLDARTDIYALGTTLFEAATGRAPFADEATRAGLVRRQLEEQLPAPSSLRPASPPWVDEVVGQATAKSPDERFHSVDDLLAIVDAGGEAVGVSAPDAVSPARLGDIRNPFKGLSAFLEADAGDFRGRERLVARLVEVLARPGSAGRLLAAVGPSGSGKSSVVRAGLVPALRRGALRGSNDWFLTTMMPGSQPFEELESALLRIAAAPPGPLVETMMGSERGIARVVKQVVPDETSELVLVIDQFEELFTLVDSEDERRAFIDSLLSAVRDPRSRLRVAVTIRADFWDRPLAYPGLAAMLESAAVTVSPLSPDELERVIVDPVVEQALAYEPGLVARITADVVDQPGALPLLQYTLTELFDRQQDGALTIEAYDDMGGLSGSLSRRAEEVYLGLDENQQAGARRVFGRLVTLGEGTEDTRRRVTLEELGAETAAANVIDAYGRARLLAFDRDPITRGPTVEVAHEALIREWPRLRRWIDEDRDGLRAHRGITQAARQWVASGREEGDLFRGGRLEAAEEWRKGHAVELNVDESLFLSTSAEARDREAERTRRTNRRLRRLAVAVSVVALVALVAGGVALVQRQNAANERDTARLAQADTDRARIEAEEQREEARASAVEADAARAEAEAQQAEADRQRGEAEAQRASADRARADADFRRMAVEAPGRVRTDRSLALLISAEVSNVEPSTTSLGALQEVFVELPRGWLGWLIGRGGYTEAQFVPGTDQVVARGTGGIDIFDMRTGELVRQVEVSGDLGLDVDSAGQRMVVGSDDGSWTIHDARTLAPMRREVEAASVVRLAFSPDDRYLAVALRDGGVRVHDLQRQTVIATRGLDEASTSLSFDSASTRLLASGGTLAAARQFDVATGAQIGADMAVAWRLDTGATSAAYVNDQPVVANGVLQVFDAESGEPVGEPMLGGEAAFIFGTIVPLGGTSALSVGDDGTTIWFDTETRVESRLFDDLQQGGGIRSSAISPDNTTLLIPGTAQIGIWSMNGAGPIVTRLPSNGSAVGISDDGALVESHDIQSTDAGITLWDVSAEPSLLATFDALGATISGNEVIIWADSEGEPALLWNPELGVAEPFVPHVPGAIELSPDHKWVAQGDIRNGVINIIDRLTGERVVQLDDLVVALGADAVFPRTFIIDVEFSPSSERLVATNNGNFVAHWDTSTWELVEPLRSGDEFFWDVGYADDRAITLGNEGIALRDPDDFTLRMQPVEGPGLFVSGRSVALSFDGTLAFASGAGGTFLFDAGTLGRIGQSFPHESDGASAQFATAANKVVTIVGDDILVWDVNTDDWPEIACRAAGRNMTQTEWEQFGPQGEEYKVTCPQFPPGS